MADFTDIDAVTKSIMAWPSDRRAALAHALIDSLVAQILPTPRPAAPATPTTPMSVQKPLSATPAPSVAVAAAPVTSPFSVTGAPAAAKPATPSRGWIDETAHR